jgi:hypothetical protein
MFDLGNADCRPVPEGLRKLVRCVKELCKMAYFPISEIIVSPFVAVLCRKNAAANIVALGDTNIELFSLLNLILCYSVMDKILANEKRTLPDKALASLQEMARLMFSLDPLECVGLPPLGLGRATRFF